jgi:hypothetical protein
MCVYVRTYVCMYIRTCVRMYVCVRVPPVLRQHVRHGPGTRASFPSEHVFVRMYVCMYVRTYVCSYVRVCMSASCASPACWSWSCRSSPAVLAATLRRTLYTHSLSLTHTYTHTLIHIHTHTHRMYADRLLMYRERGAGVYGSLSYWVSSLGAYVRVPLYVRTVSVPSCIRTYVRTCMRVHVWVCGCVEA